MRIARYAFLPVVVGLAAFFAVLPQTGADADVTIKGGRGTWRYDPGVVRIDVGDRVAFTNETRQTHTATCTQPECWDSGDIQPGETLFMTFDEEGSYGYVCRYHRDVPSLGGRVIVGDAEPAEQQSPSASPTSS